MINKSFKGARTYTTDEEGGTKVLDSGSLYREYDYDYGVVRLCKIMIYTERCKIYAQNPSPENWSGVYTLTAK